MCVLMFGVILCVREKYRREKDTKLSYVCACKIPRYKNTLSYQKRDTKIFKYIYTEVSEKMGRYMYIHTDIGREIVRYIHITLQYQNREKDGEGEREASWRGRKR